MRFLVMMKMKEPLIARIQHQRLEEELLPHLWSVHDPHSLSHWAAGHQLSLNPKKGSELLKWAHRCGFRWESSFPFSTGTWLRTSLDPGTRRTRDCMRVGRKPLENWETVCSLVPRGAVPCPALQQRAHSSVLSKLLAWLLLWNRPFLEMPIQE